MKSKLNKDQIERFSRQIILKNIGAQGQKKIFESKVLIIGMGGLGCPVAEFLTRAGIGSLGIIDSDNIELSNIHRQSLYDSKDLKKSKVTVASKKLKEINNKTKVVSYKIRLNKNNFKNIIKNFGFKYAFGQHSGVMDETKDFYELPRYPINEKYGEIKRFKSLTKTLPFKYKKIYPDEKYLLQTKNPPEVKIEFYDNIKNLKSVGCYSNEGNKWRQSNIKFINSNTLFINIAEKFVGERGRINCSLRDPSGLWRWLGIQFVISEK